MCVCASVCVCERERDREGEVSRDKRNRYFVEPESKRREEICNKSFIGPSAKLDKLAAHCVRQFFSETEPRQIYSKQFFFLFSFCYVEL